MITDVDRIYASAHVDPAFTDVLCALGSHSDEALAEAIEADGRLRLRRGRPVDLERYFSALADLADRTDALDAAIDVSLRSLSGSPRITPQAVEALVERHPHLERQIREAATLDAAVWSTSGLRRRVAAPPTKDLPCDFGLRLESGKQRYLLQELLGQGAFGQVYKARDRQLSDEGHAAVVAIKILVADRSALSRQRLLDEATKARRISHPNVVQVIDRGTSEADEDFIVYEYVDGGDLGDLPSDRLPMAPSIAAALVAKAARGVHAAHNAGLIHCDLKPANIMLTVAGEPKVADFGIAVRLDDAGLAQHAEHDSTAGPVGNIAFISPEQFRGEDGGFSVSSDIYALGGILFQLLTAHLPNGSTRAEISATHDATTGRRSPPSPRAIRPEIDHDLDAICRRALAPLADDRPDSAAALAEDLERWIRMEPLPWTSPSIWRRVSLWARRKPAQAALTAGIIVLAIAGTLVARHFAALASQRAAETEVALRDAREKQRIQEIQAAYGDAMIQGLQQLKGQPRERFVTDTMMQMWVFEYLYGPSVLDTPERVSEVWERRFETARQIIRDRRDSGQGKAMETLQWESMLAFWLASRGEYVEAIPLLDGNIQRWRTILVNNDSWLSDLQTIRQCAEINRLKDPAVHVAMDATTRAETLASIEQSLRTAADALEIQRPRSPLHFLVLRRLIDLYGDDMLNQSERLATLRTHHQDLLKSSQMQASGVAEEARRAQAAAKPGAASPQK